MLNMCVGEMGRNFLGRLFEETLGGLQRRMAFPPEFLPYSPALSIKPRSDYPVGTKLISFSSVSQLLVQTERPESLYLSNAPSYPAVSIKPSLPCPFWSTQWSIDLTQYSRLPYLLSFFPLASMLPAGQFPSSLSHISC